MYKEKQEFIRPEIKATPFCPGCGHRILMHLILKAIEESQIDMDQMLFVSGIGCAAWIPSPHFNADTLHTLHGRAIAFATGAKLLNPELRTVVISGDGDLTSIGGNHLIHAARRNIDLTVICANNMIYGMTGGQAASTSPLGTVTVTTMEGNVERPFDLCKLVLGAGAEYAARYSITQKSGLINSIKNALSISGFTFIEALSPCPTHFGRRNRYDSPADMMKMLKKSCISKDDVKHLKEEELKNKIITGEFTYGTY